MAEKKRIVWIDQLRGIAFFFVILGHSKASSDLMHLIYAFHMPLFFILSGMVVNVEKTLSTGFKTEFEKSFRRLLVPYFWLSFLMMIPEVFMWCAEGTFFRDINVLNLVKGIFYCNTKVYAVPASPLWFVAAMFLSKLVLYLILRLSKGNLKVSGALCLALVVGGCFMQDTPIPWHINGAMSGVAFMYLGIIIMRVYKEYIMKHHTVSAVKALSLGIILLLFGSVSSVYNGYCAMHRNLMGKSPVLFYFSAITMCVGIILIFICIPRIKYLEYVGQNTIPCVAVQTVCLKVVIFLFPSMEHNVMFFIFASAVIFLLMVPFIRVTKRFAPFLHGERYDDNGERKVWRVVLTYVALYLPVTYTVNKYIVDLWDNPINLMIISACLIAVAYILAKVIYRFFPIVYNASIRETSK